MSDLSSYHQSAMRFISASLGLPVELQPQDKLAAAIVEALTWLDCNAPGRAHDTLTKALEEFRKTPVKQ